MLTDSRVRDRKTLRKNRETLKGLDQGYNIECLRGLKAQQLQPQHVGRLFHPTAEVDEITSHLPGGAATAASMQHVVAPIILDKGDDF